MGYFIRTPIYVHVYLLSLGGGAFPSEISYCYSMVYFSLIFPTPLSVVNKYWIIYQMQWRLVYESGVCVGLCLYMYSYEGVHTVYTNLPFLGVACSTFL